MESCAGVGMGIALVKAMMVLAIVLEQLYLGHQVCVGNGQLGKEHVEGGGPEIWFALMGH